MTDSVHPTPDELADFQADLLSEAELDRVRAHVDDCRDCTAEVSALQDVQAMLADAGTQTLAMPDDIAAELDLAITTASRERVAAVTSLDAKREQVASRSPRRTPWVWIGGAAAAAVVVIGAIGLGGLDGIQSGGDDSDNSADAGSAADSAGGDSLLEPEAAPNDSGKADTDDELSYGARELSPDSVSKVAARLAANRSDAAALRQAGSCAPDLPEASKSTLYADVTWQGQRAVLVVDTRDRTASVFGCGTSAQPLYSTSY